MRGFAVGALTLAYPFLVYFGIDRAEPRWLAFLLAAVALLRATATRDAIWLWGAAFGLALAALSAASNALLPLKLYPVLVNSVLLVFFGASLAHPPSMIERLARLREPELPQAAIAYTRLVTQVWCAFFAVNGSIALVTALWASDEAWAVYNGFVAYVLIGLLFAGEWVVRRRVRGSRS
jgi:uncharacterized membrane protein